MRDIASASLTTQEAAHRDGRIVGVPARQARVRRGDFFELHHRAAIALIALLAEVLSLSDERKAGSRAA